MKAAFASLLAQQLARLRAVGRGGAENAALACGGIALSHGASRIYAPAGEIIAGVLLLAFAWLLARAPGK